MNQVINVLDKACHLITELKELSDSDKSRLIDMISDIQYELDTENN